MGMGMLTGLIGIVADLISVNRRLLEKLLARQDETLAPSAAARPAARQQAKRSARAA
jgi:hypothetical protein